jgi:hypothetical protein
LWCHTRVPRGRMPVWHKPRHRRPFAERSRLGQYSMTSFGNPRVSTMSPRRFRIAFRFSSSARLCGYRDAYAWRHEISRYGIGFALRARLSRQRRVMLNVEGAGRRDDAMVSAAQAIFFGRSIAIRPGREPPFAISMDVSFSPLENPNLPFSFRPNQAVPVGVAYVRNGSTAAAPPGRSDCHRSGRYACARQRSVGRGEHGAPISLHINHSPSLGIRFIERLVEAAGI